MKTSTAWAVGALSAAFVFLAVGRLEAAVVLDFATVANPGNSADDTGYGSVDTKYQIGTYEVTAGQYTQFLNAVASAADPYGLYNASMYSDSQGCKIRQLATSGGFTYVVDANGDGATDSAYVNRPVNFVSWGDAARFINWLQNGQPTTGVEDASTTENGTYFLDGQTSAGAYRSATRNAAATYFIPSENEWYKAAYYTGNSYFDFATKSNTAPSNAASATGTNNANYLVGSTFTDPTYFRTIVGSFAMSPSPNGTFDQSGNVAEWTEDAGASSGANSLTKVVRGGSYLSSSTLLQSTSRTLVNSTSENYELGFRVAMVPEPGTAAIAGMGLFSAAGLLLRRRRRAA